MNQFITQVVMRAQGTVEVMDTSRSQNRTAHLPVHARVAPPVPVVMLCARCSAMPKRSWANRADKGEVLCIRNSYSVSNTSERSLTARSLLCATSDEDALLAQGQP